VKDRNWLVRVSTTICQHWHKKNAAKRNGQTCSPSLAFRTVDGGGGKA
jgi:hypothetical protein